MKNFDRWDNGESLENNDTSNNIYYHAPTFYTHSPHLDPSLNEKMADMFGRTMNAIMWHSEMWRSNDVEALQWRNDLFFESQDEEKDQNGDKELKYSLQPLSTAAENIMFIGSVSTWMDENFLREQGRKMVRPKEIMPLSVWDTVSSVRALFYSEPSLRVSLDLIANDTSHVPENSFTTESARITKFVK